jgi:LacI family transcriptional regulator
MPKSPLKLTNRTSTTLHLPRYVQIANELESNILDGVYKPGETLPTFKELAIRFGVSIVTINQSIKELDVRRRIIRKRGEATYIAPQDHPREKSLNIGLVVPDISSPYFASLAKIIHNELLNHHYVVITQSTDNSLTQFNRCLRQLYERKLDGLILVPLEISRPEQEEILWRLKIEKIPFVYLVDAFARVPSDHVVVDVCHGVREVTRHLLELGHRRFACVSAAPYREITKLKMQTFADSLKEAGIDFPEDRSVISELRYNEGGEEAAEQILRRTPRPTAIFATNDLIAIGVVRAAQRMGLRVPEDLSVVGFDDVEMARMFTPPLTTVCQPITEIGQKAANILLQRIERQLPLDYQQFVMQPQLIVRASTAPPSKSAK